MQVEVGEVLTRISAMMRGCLSGLRMKTRRRVTRRVRAICRTKTGTDLTKGFSAFHRLSPFAISRTRHIVASV